MIQSIQLQNWRSHKDSLFEFKKGTNVLVGVMGSGKSAVVDGICFGLFGTFPNAYSRRVSLEETIMHKPSASDKATITVGFSYNNKNFSVERTIFRGSKASEAKLYCENRLIAGPKPSEVTSRIEQELEVSYNLFSRAVYSEQNQIDFFLRLSPRERKQKFDELLEINRYETARQNATMIANRIRKTGEDKTKWVQEQESRFSFQELEKMQEKIRQKKTEQQNWQHQAGQHREQAEKSGNKMKELEIQEKKMKELKETEIRFSSKIEQLQKNLEKTLQAIENKTPEKLREEAAALLNQEKIMADKKRELEKNREQIAERLSETQQNIRMIEAKKAEFLESRQNIGNVDGKCPVCKKELEHHDKEKLLFEISVQQQELEQKKMEQQTEKEKQTGELKAHKNELEKNTQTAEKIREKKMETEWLLKQALEAHSQEKELATALEKMQETKQAKQTIVFDENALKELREAFLAEKTAETNALQEARNCEQLAQAWQEQLQQLQKIHQQVTEWKQEIKQLEKTMEKLFLFTHSLQTVQSGLREVLLEAINQAMQSIWQKAYPYSDFQTSQIVIQEGDYEIMVKTRQGEWIRVEGNLSGGERSTVALCIRMAFSLVLTQNLSWLILDEPTHNLDATAVQELAGLMKNQLPELVEQIFVITHDKQLEQAACGSLYEILRDKNNEGISLPQSKNMN